MKFQKLNVAAAGIVLAASAACGSITGSSSVSAPASMGVWNSGVFDCYYIDDVSEVAAYEAAGLCNPASDPILMPDSFESQYWDYFSTPVFYNRYIPRSARYSYTHVTIVKTSSYYHSSNYASRVRVSSYRSGRH